jgi:tetratricopeptide (TPR) repeat protein
MIAMAKHEDWQLQAATLMQSGVAASNQHDYDEAQRYFEEALRIFQSVRNPGAEADAWHYLGMVAERKREVARAEDCYRKSLAIKERSGDKVGTAATYHQLAVLARKTGQLNEAEEWCKRAFQFAQQVDAGGALYAGVLSTFAEVLLRRVRDEGVPQGRLKEAQWYAEQSLALQEKRQPQSDLWRILHTLADIAKLQGRTEEWHRYRRRECENCAAFPDNRPPINPMLMLTCFFIAKGDPQAQMLVGMAEKDPDLAKAEEGRSMRTGPIMQSMGRISKGERDWHRLCEVEDLSGPEALVVLQILEMVTGKRKPPSIF